MRRDDGNVLSHEERRHLDRALELAGEALAAGNAPIGAVLVLDGRIVAEGRNAVRAPAPDPRRHAEMEALAALPPELGPRAAEMTCYASLEPCARCAAALAERGVRRVVYAAPWFAAGRRPSRNIAWIGPAGGRRALALGRRARRDAVGRVVVAAVRRALAAAKRRVRRVRRVR